MEGKYRIQQGRADTISAIRGALEGGRDAEVVRIGHMTMTCQGRKPRTDNKQ